MCDGRMAGLECHFKAKIGIAVGCTLDGSLSGIVTVTGNAGGLRLSDMYSMLLDVLTIVL
jgi:hypothetical protein